MMADGVHDAVWVARACVGAAVVVTLGAGDALEEVDVLVLARADGQTVVLDDRIVVTVLDSRPGLVRLGIEAPRDVGVRRGELEPLTAPAAPPRESLPSTGSDVVRRPAASG